MPLNTVLRRYCAGYNLLAEIIAAEITRAGISTAMSERLTSGRAALFDRLLAEVTHEYRCEASSRARSSEDRCAGLAKRILRGEKIHPGELDYDLDAFHMAVAGPRLDVEALKAFAKRSDNRPLIFR